MEYAVIISLILDRNRWYKNWCLGFILLARDKKHTIFCNICAQKELWKNTNDIEDISLVKLSTARWVV